MLHLINGKSERSNTTSIRGSYPRPVRLRTRRPFFFGSGGVVLLHVRDALGSQDNAVFGFEAESLPLVWDLNPNLSTLDLTVIADAG